MLATQYLFIALSLFISLAAAAPTAADDSVDYLVARTRTAAKKQASEAKRIMKQLDQKLSPPRDKTVFWSGRVGSGSAMSIAQEQAKKTGKTTLEMGLKKAKINMPAYGKSSQAPKLWDHASKLWAERSKGKTAAYLGQVRPQSVYNRIEKPALAKNKKVTKHTEHHLVKNTSKPSAGKKSKASAKTTSRKAARKSTPQRAKKPQAKNMHKHKVQAKRGPKKSNARSNAGHRAKVAKPAARSTARKSAAKPASRKAVSKPARKSGGKPASRKAAAKPSARKSASRRSAAKPVARKSAAKPTSRKAAAKKAGPKPAAKRAAAKPAAKPVAKKAATKGKRK